MARPAAPCMPTPKQIRDTDNLVQQLHSNLIIYKIGPDGITYIRSDEKSDQKWHNIPFTSELNDEEK